MMFAMVKHGSKNKCLGHLAPVLWREATATFKMDTYSSNGAK